MAAVLPFTVKHQRVSLLVDTGRQIIEGFTELTVDAPPSATLELRRHGLHARQLTVSRVLVDGHLARFDLRDAWHAPSKLFPNGAPAAALGPAAATNPTITGSRYLKAGAGDQAAADATFAASQGTRNYNHYGDGGPRVAPGLASGTDRGTAPTGKPSGDKARGSKHKQDQGGPVTWAGSRECGVGTGGGAAAAAAAAAALAGKSNVEISDALFQDYAAQLVREREPELVVYLPDPVITHIRDGVTLSAAAAVGGTLSNSQVPSQELTPTHSAEQTSGRGGRGGSARGRGEGGSQGDGGAAAATAAGGKAAKSGDKNKVPVDTSGAMTLTIRVEYSTRGSRPGVTFFPGGQDEIPGHPSAGMEPGSSAGAGMNAGAGATGAGTAVLAHGDKRCARYWLPCVDLERVRSTFDIEVTVPAGDVAVASGQHLEAAVQTPSTDAQGAGPDSFMRAGHVTHRFWVAQPMSTSKLLLFVGPHSRCSSLLPDVTQFPGTSLTSHACLLLDHGGGGGGAVGQGVMAPAEARRRQAVVGKLEHVTGVLGLVVRSYQEWLEEPFPLPGLHSLFVDDEYTLGTGQLGAGMAVFGSRLLVDESDIDQNVDTACQLAYAVARMWLGARMLPEHPADEWLLLGFAGMLMRVFVRKYFGNNELCYQKCKECEAICLADGPECGPLWYMAADEMLQGWMAAEHDATLRLWKATNVMAMLEKMMTTDNFRKVMQQLMRNSQRGARVISTQLLEKRASKIGGLDKDLVTLFFDRWVYGFGCPRLNVGVRYIKKKNTLEIGGHQEVHMGMAVGTTRGVPLKVHEVDGTFDHALLLREEPWQLQEVACHSRLAARGAGQPGSSGVVGVLDSPLLWLSVDPDKDWLLDLRVTQPERSWVFQLERQRTVAAQLQAIRALASAARRGGGGQNNNSNHPEPLLSSGGWGKDAGGDTFGSWVGGIGVGVGGVISGISPAAMNALRGCLVDPKCFYRVRMEAALALGAGSSKDNNFLGQDHLLHFLRGAFYDPRVGQVRPNNFGAGPDALANYFVQQAVVAGLGLLRDRAGRSPAEVVDVLVDVVKYNDNSGNPYVDDWLLAAEIDALGSLAGLEGRALAKVLKQIDRHLQRDRLTPSHGFVLTCACVRALVGITLDLGGALEASARRYMWDLLLGFCHTHVFHAVRTQAWIGLCLIRAQGYVPGAGEGSEGKAGALGAQAPTQAGAGAGAGSDAKNARNNAVEMVLVMLKEEPSSKVICSVFRWLEALACNEGGAAEGPHRSAGKGPGKGVASASSGRLSSLASEGRTHATLDHSASAPGLLSLAGKAAAGGALSSGVAAPLPLSVVVSLAQVVEGAGRGRDPALRHAAYVLLQKLLGRPSNLARLKLFSDERFERLARMGSGVPKLRVKQLLPSGPNTIPPAATPSAAGPTPTLKPVIKIKKLSVAAPASIPLDDDAILRQQQGVTTSGGKGGGGVVPQSATTMIMATSPARPTASRSVMSWRSSQLRAEMGDDGTADVSSRPLPSLPLPPATTEPGASAQQQRTSPTGDPLAPQAFPFLGAGADAGASERSKSGKGRRSKRQRSNSWASSLHTPSQGGAAEPSISGPAMSSPMSARLHEATSYPPAVPAFGDGVSSRPRADPAVKPEDYPTKQDGSEDVVGVKAEGAAEEAAYSPVRWPREREGTADPATAAQGGLALENIGNFARLRASGAAARVKKGRVAGEEPDDDGERHLMEAAQDRPPEDDLGKQREEAGVVAGGGTRGEAAAEAPPRLAEEGAGFTAALLAGSPVPFEGHHVEDEDRAAAGVGDAAVAPALAYGTEGGHLPTGRVEGTLEGGPVVDGGLTGELGSGGVAAVGMGELPPGGLLSMSEEEARAARKRERDETRRLRREKKERKERKRQERLAREGGAGGGGGGGSKKRHRGDGAEGSALAPGVSRPLDSEGNSRDGSVGEPPITSQHAHAAVGLPDEEQRLAEGFRDPVGGDPVEAPVTAVHAPVPAVEAPFPAAAAGMPAVAPAAVEPAGGSQPLSLRIKVKLKPLLRQPPTTDGT
eukprot:jgi/Mesvir1/28880/Mv17975-RA.1